MSISSHRTSLHRCSLPSSSFAVVLLPPFTVSSPRTFEAAMNLPIKHVRHALRITQDLVSYIPPAYPPRPLIPSAWTAVIRSKFSRSDMFALSLSRTYQYWHYLLARYIVKSLTVLIGSGGGRVAAIWMQRLGRSRGGRWQNGRECASDSTS